MHITNKVCLAVAMTVVAAVAQTAWADSSDATCRFYKNNHKDQRLSGPCTFSQRQGNISIKLDSGDTIRLSPRSRADQFRDQNGNKVGRSGTYGNTQVFKWDDKNKKIIVNFNDSRYGSRDWHDYDHDGRFGSTRSDYDHDRGYGSGRNDNLNDLQGMRASSGERELEDRGYRYRKTIKTSHSSIA